jgi:hypothetical protein
MRYATVPWQDDKSAAKIIRQKYADADFIIIEGA